MMTNSPRLELAPFNGRFVELKTGVAELKDCDNQTGGSQATLPEGSI